MPKTFAQELMEKHTPDRFLFASDMPWHRPSWEKRLIESLDLSLDDKEKIYCKNAFKLLNIN
jgi:predicted TIM-barrel fold metal-dependent hydrolase